MGYTLRLHPPPVARVLRCQRAVLCTAGRQQVRRSKRTANGDCWMDNGRLRVECRLLSRATEPWPSCRHSCWFFNRRPGNAAIRSSREHAVV